MNDEAPHRAFDVVMDVLPRCSLAQAVILLPASRGLLIVSNASLIDAEACPVLIKGKQ